MALDRYERGVQRQFARLPKPVAHAPLVALGDSLYLLGGDGSDTVWRIGPDGAVSVAGHLPQPLANAAGLALGRSVYLFGGDGSDAALRLTPRER
jgi:N-acetylneuraminic acid mutarotase